MAILEHGTRVWDRMHSGSHMGLWKSPWSASILPPCQDGSAALQSITGRQLPRNGLE